MSAAITPAPCTPISAATPAAPGRRHILVTGGAGYIGSHTCIELLCAGHAVTIVDNLCNSSHISVARIATLSENRAPAFYQVDIRDSGGLEKIFQEAINAGRPFHACIHFAGLKAVGESVTKPLLYYENNLTGGLVLFRLLDKFNCRRVVFSSSATVYGAAPVPINESAPLSASNPYGQTKLMLEEILRDLCKAPPECASTDAHTANGSSTEVDKSQHWRVVILRYFNPIGAHPSGIIGEDPQGIPNNLLPFVMQVAVGRRPEVNVFGNDYPTPDGTGVRDYIHVTDLAQGHLAALDHGIFGSALGSSTCGAFNLGTGRGVSVLEMIAAAEKASGKTIPYKFVGRRAGDIATCYADASKANECLHWKTKKSLEEAVADSWRWQAKNPMGFATQQQKTE